MQQWNGRMIQEANFGLFRTLITWKANKFGKTLEVIGCDPTSKVCSGCGQLLELTLKDRWIECSCGSSLHRDHNAAINILKIGLHRAGMAQIYACGDSDMSSGLWESLKQEAMSFRAW